MSAASSRSSTYCSSSMNSANAVSRLHRGRKGCVWGPFQSKLTKVIEKRKHSGDANSTEVIPGYRISITLLKWGLDTGVATGGLRLSYRRGANDLEYTAPS